MPRAAQYQEADKPTMFLRFSGYSQTAAVPSVLFLGHKGQFMDTLA